MGQLLRGGRAIGALVALAAMAADSHAQVTFVEASGDVGLASNHHPSGTFVIGPVNLGIFTSGGAVGDFDNDGWQDVFVMGGGTQPDRLFMNQGPAGGFVDQAEAWGVAAHHMGLGAAVGDVDRDGWLDIFVTSLGPASSWPAAGKHRLYRNTGNGSFVEVAAASGVSKTSPSLPDGFGAAFGDIDLDGDLDLAVAGWLGTSYGDRLFVNDGTGVFEDVTDDAIVFPFGTRGYSPIFADMNGDRYPELLHTADFATSRYFVNAGDGTFVDFTEASGTGLDANGMGAAVADVNGDGHLDWFVTSVHGWNAPTVPGTGNMLYLGTDEPHVFVENAVDAGVNDGGWGWGTDAVDIDNDGDIDILETNGWHEASGNDGPIWANERCYVYENLGDGTFIDIAEACGVHHALQGRGLLTFDADNDGDLDFIVFTYFGPLHYYRNDLGPDAPGSIQLAFDTSANPCLAPRGVGTRVVAEIGGVSRVRLLHGGTTYLSQSELSVHLGLGAADRAAEVRIEWADGQTTTLADVPAGRLTIAAPPRLGDLDADGAVGIADLNRLLARWGTADPLVDLDGGGTVDTQDVVLLLNAWGPGCP